MKMLKVCGMRDADNIKAVSSLPIDLMGLIFYKKSSRYVGDDFDPGVLTNIPGNVKKVGVFVNELPEVMYAKATRYGLDYLQLHGSESVQTCELLKHKGLKLIKAMSVGEEFDPSTLTAYEPFVDYFLLDTQCKGHGGSGKQFDWQILNGLETEVPILLAGGIDEKDLCRLGSLPSKVIGVDVNSRFETKPALKDVSRVKTFAEAFKGVDSILV